MWNKEKTKMLIREITKKYGREIAIEGTNSVIGLEEHLDKVVAEVMGLDFEIIKIARQWRTVIERAAIAEGIEYVKQVLEIKEEKKEDLYIEEKTVEEVEMKTEVEEQKLNNIEEDLSTSMEIVDEKNIARIEMKTEESKYSDMEDIQKAEDRSSSEDKKRVYKESFKNIEERQTKKYLSIPLEESIWAPNEGRCENKRDIQAKVAAVNILGENAIQREKSLRWSLRGNEHIKKIVEKFVNGNQWCIVTFDCEKGYKQAKRKLENTKEEFEKLSLICENNQKKTIEENQTKKNTENIMKKEEERVNREQQAQKELKEVFKQREREKDQKEAIRPQKIETSISVKIENTEYVAEQRNHNSQVTVWDLTKEVRRSQVFESTRHFGKIEHIEIIREAYGKTRAEIDFVPNTINMKEIEDTWCIPFIGQYLVRITPGRNNIEKLRTRSNFNRKLLDLATNTNEVLL
jgi:hypothetical protein